MVGTAYLQTFSHRSQRGGHDEGFGVDAGVEVLAGAG